MGGKNLKKQGARVGRPGVKRLQSASPGVFAFKREKTGEYIDFTQSATPTVPKPAMGEVEFVASREKTGSLGGRSDELKGGCFQKARIKRKGVKDLNGGGNETYK